MEHSYKRIAHRPNTQIPFWTPSEETLALIKSKYDDTGKRISFTVTLADGDLTEIRESVWSGIEFWQEYADEFADLWEERNAYFLANGIISARG